MLSNIFLVRNSCNFGNFDHQTAVREEVFERNTWLRSGKNIKRKMEAERGGSGTGVHQTRVHWPTAGVHRLSLWWLALRATKSKSGFSSPRVVVVFRVEEWSFESNNAVFRVDYCSFLGNYSYFANYKYLFITLLNSI